MSGHRKKRKYRTAILREKIASGEAQRDIVLETVEEVLGKSRKAQASAKSVPAAN
jgi:hypothetical protein